MTPSAPILHTFDPQIAGKIGLSIDAPPSADMVIWLASKTPGATKTQVGLTYVNATIGLDGLSFIIDAGAPGAVTYWQAKLHDATGYGSPSTEVAATTSAGPPAPPPPPTQEEMVNQALGITLATGDMIDVYPATPTTSKTVNADGTIA
jgi:hypothetical protein